MASMYVNMFAATAYYAKICAHLSGNQNPDKSVTNYQVRASLAPTFHVDAVMCAFFSSPLPLCVCASQRL